MLRKVRAAMSISSLLTAPVLFFCSALCVPAQDSGVTLHVDVKLVNVFVNVTDPNGAIVGGLTREDFAIAILDEIETPRHVRQRFTAAY